MAREYIVSFHADAIAEFPADCHGDTVATMREARAIGRAEVDRVASIPWRDRDPSTDFAVRFSISPASKEF